MVGANLCFLTFISFVLHAFAAPTSYLCRPDQRDALLEFKNEFQISEPEFSKTWSWNNVSDCCSWDEVTCDPESGEVIGLDLNNGYLHGTFKSNSSLFRLRHLESLNLAYNNFSFSPIPTELDKLTRLIQLNLSYSLFAGPIPKELLQLTNLVSLDLSSCSFPPSLFTPKQFLNNVVESLMNLRKLHLSCVNISSSAPRNFVMLSSLQSLHLDECNLFGELPSEILLMPNLETLRLNKNQNLMGSLPEFLTKNSLVTLDLSFTSLSGNLPDSIGNLKSLNVLFLQSCSLYGTIPSSLGNLSVLTSLDLSFNGFVGEVPSSIGNLNRLMSLILQNNKLNGNLPLALLNMTRLSYMDLSFNQFTGSLPSNISRLSNLETFKARGNSFSGTLPSSLFMIPSLWWIDLDGNQFSGPVEFGNTSSSSKLGYLYLGHNSFNGYISRSISRLTNLQFLDFSVVNTSRKVDLSIFSPLKLLYGLSLSGTPLSTTNMNSTDGFPSHLKTIRLSACNLDEFPKFLMNQEDLNFLAISFNYIKGKVPQWLWRLPSLNYVDLSDNKLDSFEGSLDALQEKEILWLDISSNKFQGPFPNPPESVQVLFAFSNNFTGEIPRSFCKLISPEVIDLSYNNFNGSIPTCLGDFKNSLSALSVRGNNLGGTLPETLTNTKDLSLLDVSLNHFEGKLSRSLINCTSLEFLNVGGNKIKDTFPFWLRSLPILQVLVLRSNRFYGPMHFPGISFNPPKLRIIDISDNDFVGTLPSNYFVNWSAMSSSVGSNDSKPLYMDDDPYNKHNYYSLSLRSKGLDMKLERILTILTTIDFSGNKFEGRIPESVGLLKDLIVLNLSRNGFMGNIPASMANLTQLQSLDLSLNQLSGEIPAKLGSLSFLAYINFSHNKLVGPIPQGRQFQTLPCSAFLDNLGLYNPTLGPGCGTAQAPTTQQNQEPKQKEEDEDEEEIFNWIAAGIGIAPGLLFGWTIGYIVASYWHEWFMNLFGRNKRRHTATR